MASPVVYDNAAVVLDGTLMVEATTVSVDYESGDQVANVLGGGTRNTLLLSPGARYVRIEFDLAVPTKGDSLARGLLIFDKFLDVRRVSLQVFLQGSGAKLNSGGWIMAPGFKAAVATNANIHVVFIGEPHGFI